MTWIDFQEDERIVHFEGNFRSRGSASVMQLTVFTSLCGGPPTTQYGQFGRDGGADILFSMTGHLIGVLDKVVTFWMQ